MECVRRWPALVHAAAIAMVVLGATVIAGCLPVLAQEPAAGTEDQQTMEKTIVYAEVQLEGFGECPVELFVNDIPVARAGGKFQPYASVTVPEFLIDGVNSLTLVICPGPTPSMSQRGGDCACGAKADPKMEAVARITRLVDGVPAGPGAGGALIELKWTGVSGDSLPKVVTVTGDAGKQLGAWAWQSAEILTLNDSTRKSATEFINKIKTAYENADPEPILASGKIKAAEIARIDPEFGGAAFEEMVRGQLGEMKGSPEWKPSGLSEDQYDLRLVAGGRLIEAIAKDWQPILRMVNDNFRLAMLIGRVGGEWQIMR